MNYLIAFLGGIITFISPCVLPMIPMYIAYASGLSVSELKNEMPDSHYKPYFKIFVYSLFFVIGFAVIFSLFAALFYFFVQSLGKYKIWFDRVAGLIIIVFGLHTMGIFTLRFLNYEAKIKTDFRKTSFFSSFIMGAAFGASWTPCIGPVLSGILFTSTAAETPFISITLLLTFSLGLGIPFVLTGLLTGRLLSLFDFIKRHFNTVKIISGIFLILIGTTLFFGWMGYLSGLFSQVIPQNSLENKLIK